MAEKFFSMRNLKFLLYDVIDAPALTKYEYFSDHSRETFDMTLDISEKMARTLIWPKLTEMDRVPPEYKDGKVKVHPVVKTLLRECGEGGWIGAYAPYELEGQQLPMTVLTAFRYILASANYAASIFPPLCSGAANLIITFGKQELIDTYVPKMFKGEWQGTMALTEPQAGSSLADVATTAYPTDNGYYSLKGQKIFVSAAEHDGVDNIVNLTLARIDGAPPGVKGLSLFVAPKLRPVADGGLESNDIACAGIFHKMGFKGSPITHIIFGENDDCRAWLVGEPHQGINYMFQMMNDARIGVGAGAISIGTAAYYASLEYARERPQGRPLDQKDPTQDQVLIIDHPDVRRMLLFQRAIVEGSASLLLHTARFVDIATVAQGKEKEEAQLLADLLTPICKSYPAEMCIESCSQALQILGGYGYCDEFPLEQFYREARIHPIHEGTTGIQALDLLGRKVMIEGGRAYELFLRELEETISTTRRQHPELKPLADGLDNATGILREVTTYLTTIANTKNVAHFLADATLYLELFGIITIAWQWLRQAGAAKQALANAQSDESRSFYKGKLHTCRYFYIYELPKINSLAMTLQNSNGLTVELTSDLFGD